VENYKIELPNFYHQPNKAQRKGIIKNHTVSKPTKKKKKKGVRGAYWARRRRERI
jgi:hypothetical protein